MHMRAAMYTREFRQQKSGIGPHAPAAKSRTYLMVPQVGFYPLPDLPGVEHVTQVQQPDLQTWAAVSVPCIEEQSTRTIAAAGLDKASAAESYTTIHRLHTAYVHKHS